ncbi:hypothetical protein QYS49_39795 [Marivirga salinae]|uniref:Uncharacterized protein n=1 Tax=Marivirga salinarum TaxID=3059078 RepID=A0AA51NBB1_9BACT|nr:hypothetical protein [Marivirga sp. BDSF4-3]WMN11859.1 hypothetical protein QYS49_39795 [Marivirga sp. BDSF4-3]
MVWIVSDKTNNGSESSANFKQALSFMEAGFRLMDTMTFKKPSKDASGNNSIYWYGFKYMCVY